MNHDEHFRWLASSDPEQGPLPSGEISIFTSLHILAKRLQALEETVMQVRLEHIKKNKVTRDEARELGIDPIRGDAAYQVSQRTFTEEQVRDLLKDAMASAVAAGGQGVPHHQDMIEVLLNQPTMTQPKLLQDSQPEVRLTINGVRYGCWFKPVEEDDPFALEDDCDTDD